VGVPGCRSPPWTPFHVVKLDQNTIDTVRRRVQECLGHRGAPVTPSTGSAGSCCAAPKTTPPPAGGGVDTLLAHSTTGRASNGPTGAMNLLITRIKRVEFEFRNFANYRLRLLLHCGVTSNTHRTTRIRGWSPRMVSWSRRHLLYGGRTPYSSKWALRTKGNDMRTPEETFRAMLDGADRLQNGDLTQVDKLAEFYAPETDVRHPMSPLGDTPLLNRDALRQHFAAAGSAGLPGFRVEDVRVLVEDVRVHHTADPEVIIGEFTYRGDGGWSAPNIVVFRIRDGLIVESRDYIDHLGLARANKMLDALCAQLTSS